MELVTPDIGLLFWMTLSFGIVLFILKKYAWKPILNVIKDREDSIEKALEDARKAREEIAKLNLRAKEITNQAMDEKDNILKEARDAKNEIIADARKSAKEEAGKALKIAMQTINSEKKAAMAELKSQVALLSIEIAGKILKSELSEDQKQRTLVSNLIEEIKLN